MQRELFDADEVGPAEKAPRGGYAARPGTGPAGETCRSCGHYRRVRHKDATYRKCGLMERCWTHGKGTDIKAGADARRHWEGRRAE